MSHFPLPPMDLVDSHRDDPMAPTSDRYSLLIEHPPQRGPGLRAELQCASRLTIILHFFNSLSLKQFSSFVSLSYLYYKLSRDILFRSQYNGAPNSLMNIGDIRFLIITISTVTDPFIPPPNLTVICSCYFLSHFTRLRWLNGFHHFGSQKTCYHTRIKLPRNRKAPQEPSHFPKLIVSLTKAFTGSLCNGLELTKG